LALALVALGDNRAAAAALESILLLDPSHVPALQDLAVLALGRGRLDTALERLDAALAIDGDNPRTRYYRALALEQLGRIGQADAALRELAAKAEGPYREKAEQWLAARPTA
jgi:Flp pilus assembly protein TadD